MTLNDLLTKDASDLFLRRSFNELGSPVPCSSDVYISPTREEANVVLKEKKPKKRPEPIRVVWEYLQYKILHHLLEQYRQVYGVPVAVPDAYDVVPKKWILYTEFEPGFIIKTFENLDKQKDIIVEDRHSLSIPAEMAVTFQLGSLTRIKELEHIYHADFDLRHIIFDPKTNTIAMFDLENTRFVPSGGYVEAESERMKRLWFTVAQERGFSEDDLEMQFYSGKLAVERLRNTSYTQLAQDIAQEYDIDIRIQAGKLDGKQVKLNKPKIH